MAKERAGARTRRATLVYHSGSPRTPRSAACAVLLALAPTEVAWADGGPWLHAVVRGTPAGADAPHVVLCADPWDRPGLLEARDGDGPAGALARAGYRVSVVDPWTSAPARERGFDGVVADVFPGIVDEAARGGPFAFVGYGVCGLLPVAAAARTGQPDPRFRWAAVGAPWDPAAFGPPVRDWLRAWQGGEPLPRMSVAVLAGGVRGGAGARGDSLPPALAGEGAAADRLERWHRGATLRSPPPSLVEDLLRWAESGRWGDRAGWTDYRRGAAGQTGHLLIAGSVDPWGPPEALLQAPPGGTTRIAGRFAGDGDEFGHLALLMARRAPAAVEAALRRWLGGSRP